MNNQKTKQVVNSKKNNTGCMRVTDAKQAPRLVLS